MIGKLLIPACAALGLLLGAAAPLPTAAAQGDAAGAESGEAREARAQTDRAFRRVSELQRSVAAAQAQRTELKRLYDSQLKGVEELSRQRPSWNRDRRLRASRSEADATGARLKRVDEQLRAQRRELHGALEGLQRAIAAELDSGATAAPRRAALERTRARLAAALRPKPKTIRIPDVEIDRLADPEELLQQARLIRQAEERLLREEQALRQREERYRREAALRAKRQRDAELSALDGDDVRRVSPRSGSPASSSGGDEGGAASEFDADSTPPPEPGAGVGGDDRSEAGAFVETSVVLADVVEPGTLDALRRAGRTGDARTRADAASRARKDVAAQLRLLRERRSTIERRARELKRR